MELNPIAFDVSYNTVFHYEPEEYLKHCEQNNETPTEKGYRQFCIQSIYQGIQEEFYNFDITEIE